MGCFNLCPDDIPADAFGDDVTCVDWWFENGDGVGKGATPAEAWERLLAIDEPLRVVQFANDQPRIARAPWA
jgi:hypothetical protein